MFSKRRVKQRFLDSQIVGLTNFVVVLNKGGCLYYVKMCLSYNMKVVTKE